MGTNLFFLTKDCERFAEKNFKFQIFSIFFQVFQKFDSIKIEKNKYFAGVFANLKKKFKFFLKFFSFLKLAVTPAKQFSKFFFATKFQKYLEKNLRI
jgi:hypothetical protein